MGDVKAFLKGVYIGDHYGGYEGGSLEFRL